MLGIVLARLGDELQVTEPHVSHADGVIGGRGRQRICTGCYGQGCLCGTGAAPTAAAG